MVTGMRATQRTSIDMKRTAEVVVDGIVNEEIGALPDNSVGDTLERITGVTADRFKGNANELSVRGLGPTLSFSTFNGREVSTAGPDRSVAFQQFPSELVNGVLVYKSQQADFLEGGIAGVIELRSLRPLDYGRRRIQGEVRGVYQGKDDAVRGRSGLGYRANISFTDQFETALGEVGVSIGYQHQDQATPEDYYTTNSAFIPCTTRANDPTVITGTAAQQTAAGTSFNCSNATTAPAGTTLGPRYFATTSRTFQQKVTSEVRDGLIGAVQWRPNDQLDIVLDGQYSNRKSGELRNMLAITEAARGIRPEIVGDGDAFSQGALVRYTGNSNVEVQLEDRVREEEYLGGGASVAWTGDRLSLSGDLSYSESHRTELQKATNMRSGRRVVYTLDGSDDAVPTVSFLNFDVGDPANFLIAAPANNTNYARYRLVTDRRDEIAAARVDAAYELGEDGFFQRLRFGARVSEHQRRTDANNNADVALPIARDGMTAAQIVAQANVNCRAPFASHDFMTESSTNVKSWALFDNDCLFRAYTGRDSNPLLADSRGPEDTDVTETITAVYAMAHFASELNAIPFSGNVGVRWVRTEVESRGYRSAVTVTPSTGGSAATIVVVPGTLTEISGEGEYDYLLPSLNLTFDLSETVKLRLAASRAMARVGIEEFNVGITPVADASATTVAGVLANSTTGNPQLKPLLSWNLDASLEFYLNADTAFSAAAYYKSIKNAAFDAVQPFPSTIVANGQLVSFNAVAPANDPETRTLYGFEVTGSHAFSYLPAPFDGFGVQAGYNYSEADFEFPDPSAVGPYVDPANLRGLSKHNFTGSAYWEKGDLQLRASYRYRSAYSKPNSNTNRSVRGSGYLNLSASYDLTPNVQLKLQALNITNTRDVMYKPGADAITEVSESGPQYYFGVRFRY